MILHIDMDAFFAQIEQVSNPQLKGKPVIIGRDARRGVVSTASYEARSFGVHSAMPVFMAKKLCPNGIFIPARLGFYKEISCVIMQTITNFSPLVEPVSIDEAYVDINGCTRLFGSENDIALSIKKSILKKTGLTSSIGIAPLRFLSKIASDMNKPDGITIISHEQMYDFIGRLSVKKIPGAGKKMVNQLKLLGITTLDDVRTCPVKVLSQKLGKAGIRLKDLSMGIDKNMVSPVETVKSISGEETLSEDSNSRDVLKKHILRQAEIVGNRLRKKRLKASTINIKIKESDFKLITRSIKLPSPTNSSITLFREASALLMQYPLAKKVRLVGVGASGLVSESQPHQGDLFGNLEKEDDRWIKIERAQDSVAQRFGSSFIGKASLKNLNR